MSWSAVASWNGKIVHSQMNFYRIAGLDERSHETPSWGQAPFLGALPQDECRILVSILKLFTSTPDRCYFCLWHGYDFLQDASFEQVAKLTIPGGQEFLVYFGALDRIMSFFDGRWSQSPNMWWPEDRAWSVATEIDSRDTYVGGSEACIAQILSQPGLEALPIDLHALANGVGDTINQ